MVALSSALWAAGGSLCAVIAFGCSEKAGNAAPVGGGGTVTASGAPAATAGAAGAAASVGGIGGASSGAAGASSGAAGASSGAGGASEEESGRDPFGIQMLYPSAPAGASWFSEHWAGGMRYEIALRTDANDPHGISGKRGTGTLTVSGDGELILAGSQPRIYIYPTSQGPWRDIEITVYYQRVSDDATAYAGLVVGARSGPDGHTTETPCDAHTYYARLRHDGAVDFAKELEHPASSIRARVDPTTVWPADGTLPYGRWIGWKLVSYNRAPRDVKLEVYRDLTQGLDGGTWELLNETVDDGGWFADTSCAEYAPSDGRSDRVIEEGGTAFIRNTGVTEARYRWLSVREIRAR